MRTFNLFLSTILYAFFCNSLIAKNPSPDIPKTSHLQNAEGKPNQNPLKKREANNKDKKTRKDAPYSKDIQPPPPPFEPGEKERKGCAPRKPLTKQEATMLIALFSMPNEELERLKNLITNLEKMPIERRQMMAKNLKSFIEKPKNEQEKELQAMRENFQKAQTIFLENYYKTLSKEEAQVAKEHFDSLDEKGKHLYLRELRRKLYNNKNKSQQQEKHNNRPPIKEKSIQQ